jgi:hypothetical protein
MKRAIGKAFKTQDRKYWIKKLDKLVSDMVRNRDNWTCVRCNKRYEPPTNALHCSHYFSRRFMGTRFDLNNLMALCYGCHRYVEGDKQGWYYAYMLKKLGQQNYDLLEYRARNVTRYSVFDLQMLYQELSQTTT